MRDDRPIRYVKAWTSYLQDPRYYRLSVKTRGVFWSAMLLSAAESDVPGRFVAQDVPMSMDEIQRALRCRDSSERRDVAQAFLELVAAELLEHDEWGWSFPRWEREQAAYNRETPEESKARVRRWRAAKKAARAAGDASPRLRVVPKDGPA